MKEQETTILVEKLWHLHRNNHRENSPNYSLQFMTQIVGILNLTPDSFSDGRSYTKEELRARIKKLIDDGTDIIDVGAESTAPGSIPISTKEELKRLSEFFLLMREFREVIFSLDTKKAQVAKIGIENGIRIINDVSGGRNDEKMMPLIVSNPEVSYIIMYCKNPNGHADQDEGKNPEDIMKTLVQFFDERLERTRRAGIHDEQIILDPGMGSFISTDSFDSVKVLQSLPLLKTRYHLPILVGTSRKWFLWYLSPDKWPHDRLASSIVSSLYGMSRWADYVRVHDVYEMRQAINTWKKLYST
jgi:dihydropteroate synthase